MSEYKKCRSINFYNKEKEPEINLALYLCSDIVIFNKKIQKNKLKRSKVKMINKKNLLLALLLNFGCKIYAEGNFPRIPRFFNRNREMREEILKRAERFNKEAANDSGYSERGVFEREFEREHYVEDIFKNIPKKRYFVYGVLIGVATISLGFIFKKNCSKEDKK